MFPPQCGHPRFTLKASQLHLVCISITYITYTPGIPVSQNNPPTYCCCCGTICALREPSTWLMRVYTADETTLSSHTTHVTCTIPDTWCIYLLLYIARDTTRACEYRRVEISRMLRTHKHNVMHSVRASKMFLSLKCFIPSIKRILAVLIPQSLYLVLDVDGRKNGAM